MKKLFITILVFAYSSIHAQVINSDNEYSEVVEVELTKTEIHQKINEWISMSYNSGKDVIDMNTEDKIILKGNSSLNFQSMNQNFSYRLHHTIKFSIRDNKYKIDLIPHRLSHDTHGDMSAILPVYLTANVYTKTEWIDIQIAMSKEIFKGMGYSDKKIQKALDKISNYRDSQYPNYVLNKENFDTKIKSTFQSIKDFISKSNDDDEDW